MSRVTEQILAEALESGECVIGEITISKTAEDQFVLAHRDDNRGGRLIDYRSIEDAIELAKFDDEGRYRPLKTAPNLRHGWRLTLDQVGEVARAMEYFYPGRLAVFFRWRGNELSTTPLRATLDRQSGMYRVAAKISDAQIDDVVANVCRSDGGCLRKILWRRDSSGTIPSRKLPPEKYGAGDDRIPLLCQEACAVLVNACREAVKGGGELPGAG